MFSKKTTIYTFFYRFADLNHSVPMEEKLLGGSWCSPGQKVFMASFRHKNNHQCTAFLTSNRYAVIAAQCLKDFLIYKDLPKFDDYSVVVGISAISQGIHILIEQIEVLREYNASNLIDTYDIGVIMVSYKSNSTLYILRRR